MHAFTIKHKAMNNIWLHQHKHPNLILFFAGWASEHPHFRHLKSVSYDVLYCNDYRSNQFLMNMESLTKRYRQITVIGWSLGVYMAHQTCQPWVMQFKKTIAINGTLRPIDDQFGIPTHIFEGTQQHLSPTNLAKFNRRMFDNAEHHRLFAEHLPTRPIDELKEELQTFMDERNASENPFFDTTIVSANDLIFATSNQAAFWQGKTNIKTIDGGHFPFYNFNTWDEIAEL
jgi:pimeloyl-[acyl-carrier protein] methyl ester esterase